MVTKKTTSVPFDPLDKWNGDPADVAQESVDTTTSLENTIANLKTRINEPGLSIGARRALADALGQATKGLREAKANTAKILEMFRNKGNMKEEAQLKLKDINALLRANKDPSVTTNAKITQDLLKTLIAGLGKLDDSDTDEKKITDQIALTKLLKSVNASAKDLSKEMQDSLKEITDAFAEAQAVQTKAFEEAQALQKKAMEEEQEKWKDDFKRAQDVIDDHEKEKQKKKEYRSHWKRRLGAGIAKRIGLGGVWDKGEQLEEWNKKRKELKAARQVVKITSGKMAEAKGESSDSDDSRVGAGMRRNVKEENEKELVDVLKEYLKSNAGLKRKNLTGAGKAAVTGAEGLESGMLGGLSKFFAGAGLTSLLSTLATKLGLLKLIPPIVPPIPKVPPVAAAGGGLAKVLKVAAKVGTFVALATYTNTMSEEDSARDENRVPPGSEQDVANKDRKTRRDEEVKKYGHVTPEMQARWKKEDLGTPAPAPAPTALPEATVTPVSSPVNTGPQIPMPTGDIINGAISGGGRGTGKGDYARAPALATPERDASVTPVSPVSRGAQVSQSIDSSTSTPSPGVATSPLMTPKVMPQTPLKSTGSAIQANGNVHIDGLTPPVKHNLLGMADDYQSMTGKKLPLNSAFRSFDEQAALFKSKPKGMAAAPGESIHNYGMAIDTNSNTGNDLVKSGLLAKYGFDRPMKREPWHIQPAGLTLAAAKSGVYSADAPNDQGQASTSGARSKPASQAITAAVSPAEVSSGSTGAKDSGGSSRTASRGSMGVPSQNSVKDIPTFDQSDGMFLAMNLGIC